MHSIKSLILLSAVALSVTLTVSARSAAEINIPVDPTSISFVSEDKPEITARVARISFISGDVQVRRAGSEEWERATLNLPLVEGDEIVSAESAQFEIQFDRNTHLRIAENSYIKLSRLADDGIAVSVPQGTASVRLLKLDRDKTYFEFDAPGTTIAAQKAGAYRVDAGQVGDDGVRVTVTRGGEARIYSETSGFLLNNKRSAQVFIAGDRSGEWDIDNADQFADRFESWVAERDDTIENSLKQAYYDTYYDQDIYGAEDLTANGEWIYTRSYGYVWRPFASSISSYNNWSPYRYGQWRWLAPYGWTWINDEPWGWATYHHGRWIYEDNGWFWTPYSYFRSARSWWSPGLVVMTTWGGNIIWYPLPYTYAYYNYNYYYTNNYWGSGGHHGGPHPTPTPRVTPTPLASPTPANGPGLYKGPPVPPFSLIPGSGVVAVSADQFGKTTRGYTSLPQNVAKTVLASVPAITSIKLPVREQIKVPVGTGIKTERTPPIKAAQGIKTGAAVRTDSKPLDNELRNTKMLGGRPPLSDRSDTPPAVIGNDTIRTPRNTGGVDRVPTVKPDRTIVSPPAETPRPRDPVRQPQLEPPTPREKPRYDPPPPPRERPRYDPPVRTEMPRYDPPPPAPRERPRYDPPPVRHEPKPSPPAPKPEPKPDPIESKGTRNKDG